MTDHVVMGLMGLMGSYDDGFMGPWDHLVMEIEALYDDDGGDMMG